jgi:hypothetical protein
MRRDTIWSPASKGRKDYPAVPASVSKLPFAQALVKPTRRPITGLSSLNRNWPLEVRQLVQYTPRSRKTEGQADIRWRAFSGPFPATACVTRFSSVAKGPVLSRKAPALVAA